MGRWRRHVLGVCFVAIGSAASMGSRATAGPETSSASPKATAPTGAGRGEVAPPATDDLEDMCALVTACDNLPLPPSLVPADFASCVRTMAQEMTAASAITFSLTMRECGLKSNSCSELRACALRGAKPDVCVGRGKQAAAGYCDIDGRAISCWHERVLAVRDCSLGPCPPDIKDGAAAVCSPSGTRILHCEKGRLVSLDCGAFGLKCAAGPAGPGCAPPTPACNATAKRCDGNVSVGCVNGHEVRVDCTAAGLQCGGGPGSTTVGACASPAATTGACDANAPARCEGASIKYCFAGKPRSYFCKSFGFSKCVTDSRGSRCAQ